MQWNYGIVIVMGEEKSKKEKTSLRTICALWTEQDNDYQRDENRPKVECQA